MRLQFETVDVFTADQFSGNPLAVVLNAEGLSTELMQSIAAEFNLAETTFVLPPKDGAHTAQVRIFTPRGEMPFAGHPNVGTAFVLATQAPNPPARFLFEEIAGRVPVEILTEDGNAVGAELTAPQPLKRLSPFSAEHAAAGVSLAAADIRSDRHGPIVVSVGMPFLVAELASREALKRARPDPASFSRVLSSDSAIGVYIYTRDVAPAEKPCDLQARMFFPWGNGLAEDPATGSATVATAALLADLDSTRDGELRLTIGQGFDMGRPGLLMTRVRKESGAVVSAHIGGRCAPMMEGTFYLAGEG